MQIPESDSAKAPLTETIPREMRVQVLPAPVSIAPAWHTAVLIAGIVALSVGGSTQLHRAQNRLLTYGTTATLELVMLGWVALGLWLRRIPLRSLFGAVAQGWRGIGLDLLIGFAFWIGSMTILASIGAVWAGADYAVTHRHAPIHGQPMEPNSAQKENIRMLEQLAPGSGLEIACWVLLCCLAGTIEEAVFRGYLQRQFTAWAKGGVVWGVVFSAILFGAAHGYQGTRNMVLLAVFGALFSVLAILRRGLRPGIFAHSWHDLIAGLALAFLRAHRLL
ncbi:MAG: type II CAAX endopeptidase family protein [Terracidiphilus sp.]